MNFPNVSYLDTTIKMIQKYYYDNATDTDIDWSDDWYNMYQYCFQCLKEKVPSNCYLISCSRIRKRASIWDSFENNGYRVILMLKISY